ncbi:outer dynein arm light chain 2 [Nannochloropsis oceanica]
MQEGKVSAHAGVHILLPTYQLRPREDEKFSPAVAQRLAEQVLVDELKGKAYDDESVTNWAIVVADAVKKGVKAQNIPRFKVVVQVVLGEVREQGVWVASRCLWDSITDNHTSATFINESLWCTVLIFAVYTD